jgi:hypothetical protein
MDDEAFATAVAATGKRKFVIAGVTNDVCTVFPALSLVGAGHQVFVVADAGGSLSKQGDDLALERMARAGVVVVGTNQLIAELTGSWSSTEGQRVVSEVVSLAARTTSFAPSPRRTRNSRARTWAFRRCRR